MSLRRWLDSTTSSRLTEPLIRLLRLSKTVSIARSFQSLDLSKYSLFSAYPMSWPWFLPFPGTPFALIFSLSDALVTQNQNGNSCRLAKNFGAFLANSSSISSRLSRDTWVVSFHQILNILHCFRIFHTEPLTLFQQWMKELSNINKVALAIFQINLFWWSRWYETDGFLLLLLSVKRRNSIAKKAWIFLIQDAWKASIVAAIRTKPEAAH